MRPKVLQKITVEDVASELLANAGLVTTVSVKTAQKLHDCGWDKPTIFLWSLDTATNTWSIEVHNDNGMYSLPAPTTGEFDPWYRHNYDTVDAMARAWVKNKYSSHHGR